MSQLPFDCLNEIFEHLENDEVTLHSCLLVNRLWCNVAVKILWRNSLNYSTKNFSTLIACLSNESKEILLKNGIIVSTPTLKPPIFNYASFCKVLSVSQVNYNAKMLLEDQQSILTQNFNIIVEQEIHKLFMSQISSLERLTVFGKSNVILTTCPGAENC